LSSCEGNADDHGGRGAALDELRFGGFGYHEKNFPNIIALFETLDAAELRRRVMADQAK
jgi:hypothetical protein